MYQGGPSADIDVVRIVLHLDLPAGSPQLTRHALDLVGEYGALIARSIPGAVVGTTADHPGPIVGARDGVVIDQVRRQVTVDGRRIQLACREFELLDYLSRADGRTVTRTELLTEVWDAATRATVAERTVDSHVCRLRAKLGDHAGVVATVRGVGYRLTTCPVAPAESA